jgi:ubiquinol-cytochrome c reductase cytochrome c subunit
LLSPPALILRPAAARGQRLHTADGCYECHGAVGQGGPGPLIASGPLPAAADRIIRKPANVMPPYGQAAVGE